MNGKLLWDIVKSRPKSLVVVLLLVVLNCGLFFVISYHQQPRLQDLRQQWAEKRRIAGSGGVRDGATIFRQGTSDLATWRGRIAPKKDFARLIGSLFDLAASNSLKVGGVSYKPVPVKEDNLLAFTISFGVSGKYAAVKSFIADLMRSREIMALDNISLASTKLTEESVDMRVQLTAYFKSEGP
ncbi:type 4a pilus biogenesis protein PilO [Geobacter sp. AOG1]|uniref:type 4a pilus biogenesis protein PilO n=1 Tax=Geobacter sp. AOG1 TaxID=1566346 RepID=UPI001CC6654B|nr:type 4a pilus biogenesis protein PilO [Geobacter sp. AOG1]GFE58754.1 pilus assembly protein PilO [Geobacter sp. AOG1]